VVRAVHDEFHATSQRAELANDQAITNERKMVEHIALETLRVLGIVVVGEITDQNVRVADRVLDETHLRKAIQRMRGARIRSIHALASSLPNCKIL